MNPTAAIVLLARAVLNTAPMSSHDVNSERLDPAQTNSRPWRMVVWISGVFSVLVGITLLISHLDSQPAEVLKSPELAEAKARLRLNPTDEQAKKLIRELDLRQRGQYFRRLSQMHSGIYLLLAGAAAFVLGAARMAQSYKPFAISLPKPDRASDSSERSKISRWSVAVSGSVIG